MFEQIASNGSSQSYARLFSLLMLSLSCLLSGGATNLTVGQEAPPPPTPEKVTLKWKFHPDQNFRGKLTYQVHTMDKAPKRTWLVFEYTWKVKSVDSDGFADIALNVNRARMSHRSEKFNTDYDSDQSSAFQPSAEELSEIESVLKSVRDVTQQEFQFRLSPFGDPSIADSAELKPYRLIDWPALPLQPVAVGDTWKRILRNGDEESYTLVKLEYVNGELLAWIDRKRDQLRTRFNVEQGRFLEHVTWTIHKYLADKTDTFLQNRSQRCRLELADSVDEYPELPLLQPNQPGRGFDLIANSIRSADKINEVLINEKDMLSQIQMGLYLEHVEQMDFPEPQASWPPLDWLLYSRYLERKGDSARRNEILALAADSVAKIPGKTNPERDIFLLQLAELLALAGNDDKAEKACREISPEAFTGLVVTGEGAFSMPESAMADYALLELARIQAEAGRAERAFKTASSIKAKPARSAAGWNIAIHLADQGELELALKASREAQELYEEQGKLFEFDRLGPVETKVSNYRSLALGRLALCQAKQGEQQAAKQTLASISPRSANVAATISLLYELEKSNAGEVADSFFADLLPDFRDRALTYRVDAQVTAGRLEEVSKLIEKIKEPNQRVTSLLKYCHALQREAGHSSELPAYVEQAESAIQKITTAGGKATALRELAKLYLDVGQKELARITLNSALEWVAKGTLHGVQRVERQLEIARVLANVSEGSEFDDLIATTAADSKRFSETERSQLGLATVKAYVEKHDFEKAETAAMHIADPSIRCQALTVVGKRLAYVLELETSRDVFKKAFEATKQIDGIAGLDSILFERGAIRFVAYQQAECDLEGLLAFLTQSTAPNLLAYGYLGAAEAFEPEAARIAGRFARIPRTTLTHACESNLACKLLELKLPLPPDLPWLNPTR